MTQAQWNILSLLNRRSVELRHVDGRVVGVLLRNGWAETFRGDTYSNRTIIGITRSGIQALELSKEIQP